MTDGPYSRLYHQFATEFRTIYNDDHAFAAWARLLMLADASWPMRPPLPRAIRSGVLRQLVTAGVVVLDGDCYTVLGLDAERTRRRESGRIGAAKRWQSERNAKADAIAMPSRDETSTRRESPLPPQAGRRNDGTNPRAIGANPRALGTSPRQEREAQKHGGAETIAAILRKAAEHGAA